MNDTRVPDGVIMVVGCQRSGTTLVGQMLGAHPDTVLVDEDDGGYALVDAICAGDALAPVLAQVLPRARRKYADARQDRADVPAYVVLKAPNATFRVAALRASTLPLKFVFPVRDVREVVHSMARLTHVPMIENQRRRMAEDPATAARFAQQLETLGRADVPDHIKFATVWQVKTGLYRDFAAPPLSALTLRYDRLVEDSDAWRTRLFAHCGLAPSQQAHQDVMQGKAIGNTDRERAVDAASRAQWAGAFLPAQLDDMHAVAGALMDELGLPW